jgi:hypothetical protein
MTHDKRGVRMTNSQFELIQWPELALREQFIQDALEEPTSSVDTWIRLLGKPSQFIGHKIWTVNDCKRHMIEFDAYVKAEEESREESPTTPEVDDKSTNSDLSKDIEAARILWHDAVSQKRSVILVSKTWTAEECARLRLNHQNLEKQWSDYVNGLRVRLHNLRGY